MTLTQRKDGDEGASYIELVDLLQTRGADTIADCEQLFRRVLFNIRIHNTDDHLRNHGFFVGGQGIRLSPAYDINPSVDRSELSLAIDETEATCDVSVAMSVQEPWHFRRASGQGSGVRRGGCIGLEDRSEQVRDFQNGPSSYGTGVRRMKSNTSPRFSFLNLPMAVSNGQCKPVLH
jgi:hypothetical protein